MAATNNILVDTQTRAVIVCTNAFTSGTQESDVTKVTGTSLAYFNNYVTGVTVAGVGNGYTNGDLLVFDNSGTGGTGAAGYILVTPQDWDGTGPNPGTNVGSISSVVITNGGSGYGSAPTVTVTTAGGIGQTLTVSLHSTVVPILEIRKVLFSITPTATVQVIFDGATSQTALVLTGTGMIDLYADGGAIRNGAVTPTGNIAFTTAGFASGGGYTVVLECQKVFGYGGSLGGYN